MLVSLFPSLSAQNLIYDNQDTLCWHNIWDLPIKLNNGEFSIQSAPCSQA